MRKIFFIFSLIAFLSLTDGPANAQKPDWAEKTGGTEFDGGAGVAPSKRGNDCLPSDELHWAKKAGGNGYDFGSSIPIDQWGNSYVTGNFRDTVTFGAGEANQTDLTSAGETDIFVAKYNRKGRLVWAKKAGGNGYDYGNSIAVDKRGNSYVTGGFQGTATFGAGETNETDLMSVSDSDIFIAKYDRKGRLVWAKQAVGWEYFSSYGSQIAVDQRGNSYVAGLFQGPVTFGAGEANEIELSAFGMADIFIAKYNRKGGLVWAKQIKCDFWVTYVNGIAVDKRGNSYVTGYIQNIAATFGPGEANQTVLTTDTGAADMYVAKYDRKGELVWAKQAGGGADYHDSANGFDVAADRCGNVYVRGSFGGTVTFGADETHETVLTNDGDSDEIFVAKYDRKGDLVWVKKIDGTRYEAGSPLAASLL